MNRSLLLLVAFFLFCIGKAQRMVVYDKDVLSLRMETKMGVSSLPVLELGGTDRLKVSFDDMNPEYRRFTYHIEHVGADFVTKEELFESEYVKADDAELVIEDYQPSANTTVLYNHYSFALPNVGMRPLLSGNYRLVVQVEQEDGEVTPAFEAYFAVVEQKTSVLLSGTTDTDIDRHEAHQQLEIEVNYRDLTLRDAAKELRILVLQNGRWDNAVEWPKPTAVTGTSLQWNYCRDLIFPAGNEYRKFEQVSTRYPGMFVDNVRYFDPYYYATLKLDSPRSNYLYDEDQDGRYVFRADRAGNPDTDADYMWVLFQLEKEADATVDIYVDGLWTCSQFASQYKMKYNAERGVYEALVFLKQGYYSYQYLAVPHGGQMKGQTAPIEGDFYQTENNYTVLVYYRQTGSRYDQLVGWRTATFRPK